MKTKKFQQYLFLIAAFISFPFLADAVLAPPTSISPIKPCDPELAAALTYIPTPTTMMNGSKLQWRCEGKIKVFELTAEEVMLNITDELEPGPVYTWGYNGSTPGPVIEAIEGETVRIVFRNRLPDPTTVHWHGLELPIEMDGASMHSHPPIPPGGTYIYEFPLIQSGTYMYHSGHDLAKQLSMGTSGFFIIHPKVPPATRVDHDFLVFLHMWTIPPHSQIPDTMDMMFNFFTINGKSFPDTSPMKVKLGEKVRIRFANLSMMPHPIHLHGHTWRVVASGSGDDPPSTHTYSNTIHVPTGRNMDVIIDNIDEPGDWMFHCHLPHHVTNNMHGMEPVPGEHHGHAHAGMFTLFKVMSPDGHGNGHEHNHDESHGGDHGGGHREGGPHKNTPHPGLYKGQIKLENGKILQASFELFKIQEDNKWRKLSAFLKIHLGGENTSEFIAFHYPELKYHFERDVLSVQKPVKGVSLFDIKFSEHHHQTMLKGRFRSDHSGVTGTITMHLQHLQYPSESPAPHFKGVDSLMGEYKGICLKNKEEVKKILQLETLRGLSTENNPEGNPFSPYLITGRIALFTTNRLEASIHSGSYDFFTGKLQLHTDPANRRDSLQCQVQNDEEGATTLNCGDCQYTKLKSSTFMTKVEPPPPPSQWPSLPLPSGPKVSEFTPLARYSGKYWGLLYHEQRGLYQKVMLKTDALFSSIMPMMIPRPSVSATFNLYFDDKTLISYKFPLRPFLDSSSPINTGGRNQLGFMNDHAFLVIDKWEETSIEGYFYHKEFGRVGRVQLVKGDDFPPIPLSFPLVHERNGQFSSPSMDETISLDFIPVESDEFMNNPFAPLNIKGRYLNLNGRTGWAVERGSYDFLTGRLYLLLEGGRVAVGNYHSAGEFSLFLSGLPKRRVTMLPQAFTLYRK